MNQIDTPAGISSDTEQVKAAIMAGIEAQTAKIRNRQAELDKIFKDAKIPRL